MGCVASGRWDALIPLEIGMNYLLCKTGHGLVHEQGNPFFGGGLILGVAAAQFRGAVRGHDQFSLAKGGDKPFRFCADEMLDAIFHALILTGEVGQRLSKPQNAEKSTLRAGTQAGGLQMPSSSLLSDSSDSGGAVGGVGDDREGEGR